MSRAERLALSIERLRGDLPTLDQLVDIPRVLTGEPEELLVAAARIEAALASPSETAEAELALLFLAAGDLPRARRHAEEAAQPHAAEPEVEARAHALLGRLAEIADNLQEALDHYEAAEALCPRSWRHQLDLAAVLVAIGGPAPLARAGESLSAAAALAGETEAIALVRAQLALREGDTDAAEHTLTGLVMDGEVRYAAMAAALLARLRAKERG